MPIFGEGPGITQVDWGLVERVILSFIIANLLGDSTGGTVQQSGNFVKAAALMDEVAGAVGPIVGVWDPEKSSRLIQEF